MSDDLPDCRNCGHPGAHHAAGECWTDANGHETWDLPDCGCSWYEEKR